MKHDEVVIDQDVVLVPKLLIRDVYLLLTNSMKIYEEYRYEDIEELRKQIAYYL